MRILHYSLGFPPYRTGGLTKFCMDLMRQQIQDGHEAALLWPGRMEVTGNKVSVKDRGFAYLKGRTSGIRSFEVINPLPISYDEGISDFQSFTREAGSEAYQKLLDTYKPEVIHVHTLMGLHKSFLLAAKERGIRLVFTAHDFFPVCPKVTMFRHDAICSSIHTFQECGVCNATALGRNKIRLLQSPVYRYMKDTGIIKKLRKRHRDCYLSENSADYAALPAGTEEDYRKLRGFYGSLLALMDLLHYNSTVTKAVYESIFTLPNSCVIGLTHANVADHRRIKEFTGDLLRIRYLGPMGRGKGFFYSGRHLTGYGMKDRAFAWMSILHHLKCRPI